MNCIERVGLGTNKSQAAPCCYDTVYQNSCSSGLSTDFQQNILFKKFDILIIVKK